MNKSNEKQTNLSAAVQQLTLENGLAVVWEEDHRQPLVAIEVRILGGLRGEGRFLGTGITHFIEHMLFKGTPSRPPGMIDQEVRRYGGTINAFTSHDYTGVTFFVESKFLQEGLGMLADILQHATFPPEEFAKERAVVISEIQMNHDDPDRRLEELFWSRQFLLHPYRHPILGYQPLLERLTVEDLRAFYRAQYVPDNIVLACVGDLDAAQFPRLVQEVFGAWPRSLPYQIAAVQEPPAVSVKYAQEELPIQVAYAILGFSSTRLADPDLYPLDVLANVIGQGQSSRLYEGLVRKQQMAHTVSASNYTPFDPGAFTIALRADPERLSAAIEAALEMVDRVKRDGILERELNKAKRQVLAHYVFHRQTIQKKAGDLATDVALTGDPAFSKRYYEGINRVTRDQVQQVALRYLDRSRMTIVSLRPTGTAMPQASPPLAQQPRIIKTVLPNGLTVLTGVNHHLPMGVIVVVGRGGVRVETEETQGLSNLVAQLLLKGTTRKTASDIAAFVESRGGALDAFSGRDGFGLTVQLLSEDLRDGLALVQELITKSTFPEHELTLERQLILKELAARDDDIFDVGSRLLRRTLFTTHPYRFDPMGSPQTIQRLTRADCLAFAKRWLVPQNLIVAIFGDFEEPRMLQDIATRFGTLPSHQVGWPQALNADPLDGVRQASMSLPKEQSVILFGFRGTRAAAEDRYTLDVLTTVLSGMSGRLFQAVRERQGLSYTLGAIHVPGWDPGYIIVYAATKPEERQQVLTTLQAQLQQIAEQGVQEEEVEQAKRQLIGIHRLELQHLGGLARRAALDELYGLGYDTWTHYEARINAVTTSMVHEAATKYLQLSHRAEVVITPDTGLSNQQGSAPVTSHDGR